MAGEIEKFCADELEVQLRRVNDEHIQEERPAPTTPAALLRLLPPLPISPPPYDPSAPLRVEALRRLPLPPPAAPSVVLSLVAVGIFLIFLVRNSGGTARWKEKKISGIFAK
jgi:hypothetical protein